MIQAVDVSDLVAAAAGGDRGAWDGLVERYMPLVLSVVRRYRLNDKDAEDVSQTVWLRLVEHLDKIREPRALPGWISTTTRHEALAVIKAGRRTEPVDLESFLPYVVVDGPLIEDDLLRIERSQALRDGLDELSPDQRRLLLLLVSDPSHELSGHQPAPGHAGRQHRADTRSLPEKTAGHPIRAVVVRIRVGLGRGGRRLTWRQLDGPKMTTS